VTRVTAIGCEAATYIGTSDSRNCAIHATAAQLQSAARPLGRQCYTKIDGLALRVHRKYLAVHHAITAVRIVHPSWWTQIDRADWLADRRNGNGSSHFLDGYVCRRDDFLPGSRQFRSRGGYRLGVQYGRNKQPGQQSAGGHHGRMGTQEGSRFSWINSGNFHESALML
jgi:hypothetical protein